MLYNFEDMADLLGDELLMQEVTEYTSNGSTDDFYSKKLEYYEARIKLLELRITPEQLTGNPTEYKGYRSVEIYRG